MFRKMKRIDHQPARRVRPSFPESKIDFVYPNLEMRRGRRGVAGTPREAQHSPKRGRLYSCRHKIEVMAAKSGPKGLNRLVD